MFCYASFVSMIDFQRIAPDTSDIHLSCELNRGGVVVAFLQIFSQRLAGQFAATGQNCSQCLVPEYSRSRVLANRRQTHKQQHTLSEVVEETVELIHSQYFMNINGLFCLKYKPSVQMWLMNAKEVNWIAFAFNAFADVQRFDNPTMVRV